MDTCISPIFDFTIKLTDLLTFSAVILTFLTLIQLKRQRESMYIPDIFLGERHVDLFGFDLKDRFSDFTYTLLKKPKEEKNSEKIEDKSYPWLDIYIHNIGFGAAKYIKGTWEYDFSKFISLIKKVLDKEQFELSTNKRDGINEVSITHLNTDHFSSARIFSSEF